ncbi:MAG: hypothetical protein BWY79_02057 [Actinobacteria bacterium ADurb.Bin444]|nr:MAG: hypothetical protein BWY79_02057 [Actinobacteria bacterium ADurb.Bin444]
MSGDVGRQVHGYHPEGFRHEGATLLLALRYENQSWTLHTTHAQELVPQAPRRQRHETRECSPPNEVDILTGLACVRQRVREVIQLRESAQDVALSQGGEAGTPHVSFQAGVGLRGDLQRLQADQLSLAIVVSGDHQGLRLRRQLLDGFDHRLGRHTFDQRSRDEVRWLHLAPVGVLLRELHPENVAFQAYDPGRLPLAIGQHVIGDSEEGLLLNGPRRQDFGDFGRCVVLLRDDQLHAYIPLKMVGRHMTYTLGKRATDVSRAPPVLDQLLRPLTNRCRRGHQNP